MNSVADMKKFLEAEENSEQLPDKLNAFPHFMTDTEIENGRSS